jgi:hypothetical protein
MTAVDEREYPNGWKIEIHLDQDPWNPREWDNLGTMVTWHQRYTLGDEQANPSDFDEDLDDFVRSLKSERGARCVMPLYLFDHSGLSMSTDDLSFRMWDSAGWDWGMVGLIFTTTERLRAMACDKWKSKRIRKALRDEVTTYDDYLNGNVYGFVIRNPRGEETDSCWGFYPDHDPAEDLLRGYSFERSIAHIYAEAEAQLPNTIAHIFAPVGIGM